jgi:hypothetical protein
MATTAIDLARASREFVVQGSIGMTRGSLLRIDDGREVLIYVWEGEIWLTQTGEYKDRILKAGEWIRLDRDGAAIAWSLERSVLTLTAPQPEHYARRVQLVRAGTSTPVVLYSARNSRGASLARYVARLRRAWAGLFVPQARPTTASL